MGGTDDPENLIEVTVEEHAKLHKELYKKYGYKEDKVAWLALSKQIGHEEIWLERSSMGGEKNRGVPKSQEHKDKISESLVGKKQNSDTRKKISNSMRGNTNSINHSSTKYKRKQSETMKKAWQKRKANK